MERLARLAFVGTIFMTLFNDQFIILLLKRQMSKMLFIGSFHYSAFDE